MKWLIFFLCLMIIGQLLSLTTCIILFFDGHKKLGTKTSQVVSTDEGVANENHKI